MLKSILLYTYHIHTNSYVFSMKSIWKISDKLWGTSKTNWKEKKNATANLIKCYDEKQRKSIEKMHRKKIANV